MVFSLRRVLAGTLSLLLLAAAAFLALYQIQPPRPVPEDADPASFSSGRALRHLRVIASEPRPVGSSAHSAVRAYLFDELTKLGLDPSVQTSSATLTIMHPRVAVVRNIVGRLRGKNSSRALALVTHYDSVPGAPGAGDAGTGVAVILETIRALKASASLRNDILVLFTDAEEIGLLGAKAFAEGSPLINEIGFVINLEGRGTSGPSIMFETNEQNGRVIREFAASVPQPVAYSLTYDLYKRLPNNTDFTVFKHKGLNGLNFSHIGDVVNYHSVYDDLLRLDERTIQHCGELVLAATRRFGDLDLTNVSAPNVVYFNFLFPSFVVYREWWAIPLALVVTLLFVSVFVFGVHMRRLTVLKTFLSALLALVRTGAAGAAVYLLWRFLGPLQPEFGRFYLHTVYNGSWYLIGFLAIALAVGTVSHRQSARSLGAFNLAMGGLLLWLLLMWATTLLARGTSFLFALPLAVSLLGGVYWIGFREQEGATIRVSIVTTVCAIPGVFLFTQMIALLFDAMTLLIGGVLGGLLVLLSFILQPLLTLLTGRRSWVLPSLLTLVAALCFGLALAGRSPSERRPTPNSMLYALDMDRGSAVWASWEREVDEWTGLLLSSSPDTARLQKFFPLHRRPLLVKRAPALGLSAPQLTLLTEAATDTTRELSLRVRSVRGATSFLVHTDSLTGILEASANGKRIGPPLIPGLDAGGPWMLEFFGSPDDSLDLKLITKPSFPVTLVVVDKTEGLPANSLLDGARPRPPWMIPRPFETTDVALVARSYRL